MAASAGAAIISCAEQSYVGILPIGDRLPATWAAFLEIVRQHYPRARVLVLPQWLALLATVLLTPFRRIRPNPGLETSGTVRSYNFNLAVYPGPCVAGSGVGAPLCSYSRWHLRCGCLAAGTRPFDHSVEMKKWV